jgi:hypothetical protein
MVTPNMGNKLEENILVIRSEEDAYSFLESARSGTSPSYKGVRFDGWPSLELLIKGDKFNQSITPSVMRGLLEFQRGIYKAYAVAKYGESAKRLTEEEREQLEIKVDVRSGSSQLGINFNQIAIHIVDQLTEALTPGETIFLVVFISLLFFGNSAYKNYLEDRRKTRAEDARSDAQKQLLEAQKFQTEQETKRTEIIASIAKDSIRNMQIVESSHDAQHGILKSLAAGTESRLGDEIALSQTLSKALAANPRKAAKEVRLDGSYRITRIDWSGIGSFRVRVEGVDNGLNLDADVQDDSLDGKHKEAIKAAEWSRQPVWLQVNAKHYGDDDYRSIIIMAAEPPKS